MGHVIKASDPQLAQIDVSMPRFLAREDIVQVDLPARRSPREATVLREETASLWLSLKTKIDQFHLEDEREEPKKSMV